MPAFVNFPGEPPKGINKAVVIHSPLYVNKEFSAILEKTPNSKPHLISAVIVRKCQKELEKKGLYWAFNRQSDVNKVNYINFKGSLI